MENNNTNPNLNEGEPNISERSSRTNNTTTSSERMEKTKYKIPILSDRETDLTKINPKMWWEQISEYIHLTYNRNLEEIIDEGTEYMDPHTVYHIKGDVIWALGPKAKHEIMRGQWGRELKEVNLSELLTLFKKTFLPARNIFHSRAQFFNMKQEDNETLDECWKRLVDIERKCDFGNITAEEIITYKFASTIKAKKARDKFIRGPLKLQLVLDTIELDNYNRKYGDKRPKSKKARKDSSNSSTSTELIGHTNQSQNKFYREKEVSKPGLPLLRKTELVNGTYLSGTEGSVQQLQKDRTLCQNMQIQDRQPDKRNGFIGQQYRTMAGDCPYSVRQRCEPH